MSTSVWPTYDIFWSVWLLLFNICLCGQNFQRQYPEENIFSTSKGPGGKPLNSSWKHPQRVTVQYLPGPKCTKPFYQTVKATWSPSFFSPPRSKTHFSMRQEKRSKTVKSQPYFIRQRQMPCICFKCQCEHILYNIVKAAAFQKDHSWCTSPRKSFIGKIWPTKTNKKIKIYFKLSLFYLVVFNWGIS